ncbi:alpha/beta hydrolase-fold protein [Enterobacteriaceae bacterium H20N1]|uniref:Alpha/beta hydrolase-fold protein n=1 Tax=Dryocola boscaweniae TaxID=2925397 RepID=A0A9X2WBU7_9ENTR|nr:alpha/beta hydrolase-fold protein [Dryocola boscaweniae]MCT4704068.1 alpha/beta hydrolase-fold protein [Dryocola boscaweniae]MCT4721236.1 alpha/beta hydrolase-fold protein [Dryocola boscaweniae]
MNRAWIGLMLGLCSASAMAATCAPRGTQGEQEGKFDASGEICFSLPSLGENYASATIAGARDAKLLDAKGYLWRALVENGPADGQHDLLFALPVKRESSLLLRGDPGARWHFKWQIRETTPLPKEQMLEPVSPVLKTLLKTLQNGGTTDAFWQARQEEGTPLVEHVDDTHKRVTFLWRGARGNAFILGSPAGDHDPLFRLGQSDVWFRSYVVPSDTLMQYKLAPDVPVVAGSARDQRRAILVTAQADPLNPLASPALKADRWNRYSLLNLTASRYCTPQAAGQPIRNGSLIRYQVESTRLGNSREVTVYRPRTGQPVRWSLLVFDGKTYQDRYHLANVMDGLIARHSLLAINVIFIDSLDNERRQKELPPNVDFADFMALELMPWLKNQGISTSAQRTIVAGSSYGGIASSWVALRYPQVFGNVLSLSGSYWWAPKGEKASWLTRQYQQLPEQPVRFWLQAGRFESHGPNGGIYRNTLEFEKVLREKGYKVSFHPWSSGHDYAAWCEAMVTGVKDLAGRR